MVARAPKLGGRPDMPRRLGGRGRLFDSSRNPDERVGPDDWHPGAKWQELDAGDTVGQRRRWFRSLESERRVRRVP